MADAIRTHRGAPDRPIGRHQRLVWGTHWTTEGKNVDLATNSVGALKIKNGAVTSIKVRDGSLTGADLAPGAVTPSRISGVPSVRAFNSADEAIPTGAFTSLTLNSERFDATGMHRTDIDTSRITIATAGIYLVTGDVTWLNAPGGRELNVRKNEQRSWPARCKPPTPARTRQINRSRPSSNSPPAITSSWSYGRMPGPR